MTSLPVSAAERGARRRAARSCLAFIVALAVGAFSACHHAPAPGVRLLNSRPEVTYTSGNYSAVPAIPRAVRRVAVLPLHAADWRASEIAGLESSLREALGRTERFEVVPVSRARMATWFGRESFASTGSLPADLLTRLHAEIGADAVLLLDLTHFAPYQPLALGLRARLVTVQTGEALWSFDAIFDAAHPDVNLAARQFSTGKSRPPGPAEDNSGILQSPTRFAQYVGASAFDTLPPRRSR